MFLSDVDIRSAVQSGDITLKPFATAQLQPASYDIRLGNKFIINEESATHIIDPVKKVYAKTREITVKDGKEFVLHPGISVLGSSKEFFGSDPGCGNKKNYQYWYYRLITLSHNSKENYDQNT